MKKLFTAIAVGLAAFALSACNGTAPTLTFSQQVAIACAATSTELNTLQVSGVFTGGAQTTLTNQIKPDVAAVCAAGATVTKANLQNLIDATIPAVTAVVGNSSLSQVDKNAATAAIGAIGSAVSLAIALMPAPVSTAAPASGAAAASAPAPAAASTPLAGAPLQ